MYKTNFASLIIALTLLISSPLKAQVKEEWVARYNGQENGGDNPSSIAIDGSRNVYVTGTSFDTGTGFNYATIKYNSTGVQQWCSKYSGPGNNNDAANSIALDNSGNVYVTGSVPESEQIMTMPQ